MRAVTGLLEDIPALTEVLIYVVSGSVLAETVVGLESAKTLQGNDVEIYPRYIFIRIIY